MHRLGTGLAAVEVEFCTVNDRVRRADAVWFAPGRLAQSDLSRYILPGPHLAVGVVSPTDLATEVRANVREYLEAGVTFWNRGRGVSAVSDRLNADCLHGVSIPLGGMFPGNHVSRKYRAGLACRGIPSLTVRVRQTNVDLLVRYAVEYAIGRCGNHNVS